MRGFHTGGRVLRLGREGGHSGGGIVAGRARQLAGNADYVSSGREGSPLVRTQNVGKP